MLILLLHLFYFVLFIIILFFSFSFTRASSIYLSILVLFELSSNISSFKVNKWAPTKSMFTMGVHRPRWVVFVFWIKIARHRHRRRAVLSHLPPVQSWQILLVTTHKRTIFYAYPRIHIRLRWEAGAVASERGTQELWWEGGRWRVRLRDFNNFAFFNWNKSCQEGNTLYKTAHMQLYIYILKVGGSRE